MSLCELLLDDGQHIAAVFIHPRRADAGQGAEFFQGFYFLLRYRCQLFIGEDGVEGDGFLFAGNFAPVA